MRTMTAFDVIRAEKSQAAAGADDACASFLRTWGHYKRACAWMAAPGRVAGIHDRLKFYRLERAVVEAWGAFSAAQRDAVGWILYPAGTRVRAVLEIFGGTVEAVAL